MNAKFRGIRERLCLSNSHRVDLILDEGESATEDSHELLY